MVIVFPIPVTHTVSVKMARPTITPVDASAGIQDLAAKSVSKIAEKKETGVI